MIEFRCPSCKSFFTFPDEMAGQKINCPHCKKAVSVEGKLVSPDEIPAYDKDIPQPPAVLPAEATNTQYWGKMLMGLLTISLAISVISFISLLPTWPDAGKPLLLLCGIAVQLALFIFIRCFLRDYKALYNWVNWLKENLPKMIEQGRGRQDEKPGEENKEP